MRNVVIIAAVLIGLSGVVIILSGFPPIATPRFIVSNLSDKAFSLTVKWRDQSMPLGDIEPHEQLEFRHNGEADMTFNARFPNGVSVSSKPIHFKNGTIVYAQVSRSGIEVSYKNGT